MADTPSRVEQRAAAKQAAKDAEQQRVMAQAAGNARLIEEQEDALPAGLRAVASPGAPDDVPAPGVAADVTPRALTPVPDLPQEDAPSGGAPEADVPAAAQPAPRRRRTRRAFLDPVDMSPREERARVSMSIPVDVLAQMAHHCLGHRAASGRTLTRSAVVDAALGSLPTDLPGLIELGLAHGAPTRQDPFHRSSYVVRATHYKPLSDLSDQLIANGYSPREVLANDVYVAALVTWLAAMVESVPDREDSVPVSVS